MVGYLACFWGRKESHRSTRYNINGSCMYPYVHNVVFVIAALTLNIKCSISYGERFCLRVCCVRECVCESVSPAMNLTRPTPLGCSAWPVAAVPARRGSCAGEGLLWPTRRPRRPRSSPSGSLLFRWSLVQRCSPRPQACHPPPREREREQTKRKLDINIRPCVFLKPNLKL